MEENKICVYVKTDNDNNVIEVGSDIFISDLTGWILIDTGVGDRYAHAQSQYFNKPLVDDNGNYNYTLVDGQLVTRDKTAESQSLTSGTTLG